jgi:hypothetical protein
MIFLPARVRIALLAIGLSNDHMLIMPVVTISLLYCIHLELLPFAEFQKFGISV